MDNFARPDSHLVQQPAVRAAEQRRDAGARLDDREKEIMREYDRLEAANNTVAYLEQASKGGTFKTTRPPSIPSDLFRIEKIADPRERAFAIRELRSQWRDNPQSAFNDVKNPEHHNHVQAMRRLYEAESELGPLPEDPE